MASSVAEAKNPFVRKEGLEHSDEYELDDNSEAHGLLSGQPVDDSEDTDAHSTYDDERLHEGRSWSTRKMACVGAGMILLLLGASFARPFMRSHYSIAWNEHPNSKFVGGELRSNGTTEFKRTVIIVSIDGLRYANLHLLCYVGLILLQG